MNDLKDPICIKERTGRVLSTVLSDDKFHIRDLGLLGSHSIRMFAVTFAHGNGCNEVSMCLLYVLIPFLTMSLLIHVFGLIN